MNLMEASIDSIQQIAKEYSEDDEIDEHWQSVLPEVSDIMANEIFLTSYRRYINEPMRRWAMSIAQNVPPRDVSNLNDATLVLNNLVRRMLLSFTNNPEYQAIVDDNVGELVFEPNRICWVASASGVLLPLSEGNSQTNSLFTG